MFVCLIGLARLISLVDRANTEDIFVGTFKDRPLTLHVADAGPFLGTMDLEVRHPFWVSARPQNMPPRAPTDPAAVAEAWTTDTYTNLRTLDGVLVEGATLHQEWIAVSLEEGARLQREGFATIGSSGGFVFGLIRQTASPETTAAFGLKTIDNGEFIRDEDTVQGICG